MPKRGTPASNINKPKQASSSRLDALTIHQQPPTLTSFHSHTQQTYQNTLHPHLPNITANHPNISGSYQLVSFFSIAHSQCPTNHTQDQPSQIPVVFEKKKKREPFDAPPCRPITSRPGAFTMGTGHAASWVHLVKADSP